MKSGNLLILQSGIPSVVGNAVLYGMLSEALNYEDIEEVFYVGFINEEEVDFKADIAEALKEADKLAQNNTSKE